MCCLGGTDRTSAGTWVPAYGRQPARGDSSLPALLHLAVETGRHAFTAHDLTRFCAAWVDAQLPVDIRRQLHRAVNENRSGRVVAGLTLLLALCGWINGGDEGAKRAVIGALPGGALPHASGDAMRHRRDVRRLHPFEAPQLFAVVSAISRRAGLYPMPAIYVLPGERSMNAYALGTSEDAVITLTDGLLRGMTQEEIAAILAHEIAHICSDDASTMALAASLHRAIRFASLTGLAATSHRGGSTLSTPLVWLLQSAPAIAELLCLALSRIRELAADALALELIAEPRTLAAALEKLERHHTGGTRVAPAEFENELTAYLRSHPSTDQRVSFVHSLA